MSLRLTKPGQFAADQTTDLEILLRRSGDPADDPDNPEFTGEGDDEDEEDEDDDSDDEDEDERPKPKGKKKSKKAKDDDDDDEDDDEEDRLPTRPERQAAKYRTERNALRTALAEVQAELKAIRDKDKKPEELTNQELEETRKKAAQDAKDKAQLRIENAFLKVNVIDWVDPEDALFVADREGLLEDAVDGDGTVDRRALRAALKDLARRKPHLVKKAKAEPADDDREEDDDEPRSRRSAPKVNGKRKGSKDNTPDRSRLAKSFPVLNRL